MLNDVVELVHLQFCQLHGEEIFCDILGTKIKLEQKCML